MRIQKYNEIKKFQMGGEMPVQDPNAAPMEAGAEQVGQDEQAAMQQLAQLAQQLLQELGPENCAMLAQIIMEMLQGGGGPAPVGEQPEGEPVFKKGGKICGRMKKGAKMKKCGK